MLGDEIACIYFRGFVHFSESKFKHFLRKFLLQYEELKCKNSRIIFCNFNSVPLCMCILIYF